MSHEPAKVIYIVDDNDFVEIVGPVRGRDPATGERELYHGVDVIAFVTGDPLSNVPIGTLSYAASEIGSTGRYPVLFDGAAIKADLAAEEDGATLFRVIQSPGNFRVVDALTYKKSRPSD